MRYERKTAEFNKLKNILERMYHKSAFFVKIYKTKKNLSDSD